MLEILSSSVTRVDSRTVVTSCTFDVTVSDWRQLVETALVHAPTVTTVSLDNDQAFLVFKRKWSQPDGGLQLSLSVSGTGSEIRAGNQSP